MISRLVEKVKALFAVRDSIPLKPQLEWRRLGKLAHRELIHFIAGLLATFGQLAVYPDVWVSRIAAAAVVLAVVALYELANTLRGQQPWKGAIDLAVWASAATLAAIIGL